MARKNHSDKQTEISDSTLKKIANLKPFPKGKSGNPNGRPPSIVTLASEIKNVFSWKIEKTGLTYLQTLVLTMIVEAIEGNQETREMLFDRGFGTLIQKAMLMQLGGDILKIAQGLGLDANDLKGSSTLRGLLETSGLDSTDTLGIESDSRSEAGEGASTVEDNHSDG